MQKNPPKEIGTKESEFCTFVGIVGIAFSLTCLIQHLHAMLPFTFNYYFSLVYVLTIISYFLLTFKKHFAIIVLLISAIMLFGLVAFYSLFQNFSVLAILLMIFTFVITILLMINEYPTKLKQHHLYKKQENSYWSNKLQ